MYKLRVALLLTVASVTQASSWGLSHNLTDNKDVNNMVKWAESQLNKLLNDFGNNTTFWRAVEKLREDPQYNSSKRCFEAYKNIPKAQWGPLIDASAKPAAGLKNGAVVWMGSYKQCQSLPNTHFCTFNNIFLNNNTQAALNIGLCIPQDCGTKDITGILQTLMYLFHISSPKARIHIDRNNLSIQTYGADSFCMKKDTEYSTGSYVMISVCVVLAALCILGTIVELTVHFLHNKANSTYILYVDEEDDKLTQNEEDRKKEEDNKHLNISMHAAYNQSGNKYANFMMCFSLVKNTKAILNTDIPKGAITSINGIRVISITWVIMGHSLLFDIGTFNNMLTVFGWAKRFTMQALINATVSVDTFFLLSGLLVGYLSMKRYVKIGSLPLVRYYVHRYIRLTPSYLVMILFFTFVYPFLSNGPFWYMQGPNTYQAKMCRENWWSNILYINNFYPDLSKMCVGWSWYLANDMQFYVVSPIILYLMHRFKLIGTFVTNGVLLLACFICNGVLLYVDQSSPVFFDGTQLFNSGMMDYMKHIYMKPYTRIGTYLVGLVLGYILVHKPKPYAGKYKYLFHLGGWAIAIATGLAVIYGPYSQTKHPWSRVEVQFYGILFRFAWVVAVAWVIYACHVGYGGLINDILSWRAFIPLSRLTYSTYLVHPMAINFFFASMPSALYMTEITFAYLFVAITLFSYVTAFILSVCVEYPVFNLEKLFFDF